MPWVAMRTLSKVKSSPMMPRHPEVPNLIMSLQSTAAWELNTRGTAGVSPAAGRMPAIPGARFTQYHCPTMSERPVLLIADDDEDVQRLLTLFVRPLDCEVLTARDGEEALAIAQSRLPELVLLDVMMPKRSGWEVCQALKAVQRTSNIAVVLVTGRGDVKDRLTGLQLGADDYFVKPFNRDEVVKRIGALLNRKQRDPSAAVAAKTSESMLFDRASGLPTVPMVLSRLKEMLLEPREN